MMTKVNAFEPKLIIAHLRELNQPGDTFEKWPLHVTILPWFNLQVDEACKIAKETTEELRACRVVLGARVLGPIALYGAAEDIPVRPILNSTTLGVIHGAFLSPLHKKLHDKTFVGGGYNPHMTIRENEDPGEGYSFMLDEVSLVSHEGDHKLVVNTFDLKNEI